MQISIPLATRNATPEALVDRVLETVFRWHSDIQETSAIATTAGGTHREEVTRLFVTKPNGA